MRNVLRAAALTVALASVPAPAHADPGAIAFYGVAYIDCFGCGASFGTADLSAYGATAGRGVISGSASATYTTQQPAGPACVLTGTATGSVSGAVYVTFGWTRVGALALITTNGEITGTGTATFRVVSPGLLIPCGRPVVAEVIGAISGI